MKRNILKIMIFVLSVFSLIYFVMLMVMMGPGVTFSFFWLFLGLFFLGIALILQFSKKTVEGLPRPVLLAMECIVIASCLLFIVIEGLIIRQGVRNPVEEADYLVVLGAKVNGVTPSKILNYRIEKAAEYLKAHPDTKVVVSGGKGKDEGISEALAMCNGLVQRGIEESRIYLEEQSTSTKENLEFSKIFIDIEDQNVIVVTTDFHVLRAVKIAQKAGYRHVEGLAAKSVWYLVPTNYVREFLALLKDKVVGNI